MIVYLSALRGTISVWMNVHTHAQPVWFVLSLIVCCLTRFIGKMEKKKTMRWDKMRYSMKPVHYVMRNFASAVFKCTTDIDRLWTNDTVHHHYDAISKYKAKANICDSNKIEHLNSHGWFRFQRQNKWLPKHLYCLITGMPNRLSQLLARKLHKCQSDKTSWRMQLTLSFIVCSFGLPFNFSTASISGSDVITFTTSKTYCFPISLLVNAKTHSITVSDFVFISREFTDQQLIST